MPAHPDQKEPFSPGTANAVDHFAGNEALAGKAFPPDWFTGNPDDAGIRGRRDVAERENHGITWI